MATIQVLGQPRRPVRRGRPRRALGARGSSRIAKGFYDALVRIMQPMLQDVEQMVPWLESNPGASVAYTALTQQAEKWRRVLGPSLRGIARKWADTTNDRDRLKLQASLSKALGVKEIMIFDDLAVKETVEMMSTEAVHLITKIPDEYFDRIEVAVMKSYQQERLPEGRSLIEEIQEITGHQWDRAKLIAVDQTNKMHGMVTMARQQSLGIEEYTWRTAGDQRVVGDPSGLYPKPTKLHGNHYIRSGKVFRWDEPPDDGHPGWPIRCRCHGDPVIDYDKLKLQ